MIVVDRIAMTFAIHASRDGQSVVTIRISPAAAIDKARLLQSLGWQVYITDAAGHQFIPPEFHQLLLIDQAIALSGENETPPG